MPTPHTPIGFHCQRFDMRLLEEVIAVEMDIAVRRLQMRTGLVIDERTRTIWTQTVRERVERKTFAELDAHTMLPDVLNRRLADEVACVIAQEAGGAFPPAAVASSGFLHLRHLTLPLQAIVSFFGEKRLE